MSSSSPSLAEEDELHHSCLVPRAYLASFQLLMQSPIIKIVCGWGSAPDPAGELSTFIKRKRKPPPRPFPLDAFGVSLRLLLRLKSNISPQNNFWDPSLLYTFAIGDADIVQHAVDDGQVDRPTFL